MKTSIIGFPRVGPSRELKFASEQYFRDTLSVEDLQETASQLRKNNWSLQKENGIDFIPSNDFSYYDNALDTAFLLNVIPQRYKDLDLPVLDTYFAAAKGYQGDKGDVKALAMMKWFNTNYHYMVPEIDDEIQISLVGTKPFDEFNEAKEQGVLTQPVLIGPFTFLKLTRFTGTKTPSDYIEDIAKAYSEILAKFNTLGAQWIQFDEPSLVTDLDQDDIKLFEALYNKILPTKDKLKVLLQTYFGDIRDCYNEVTGLDFDGIGLDFIEGQQSLALVEANSFPKDKILFAGVVNGKNIWRNNYADTLVTLDKLGKHAQEIVLNTSCSLLHVPYSLENETDLPASYKKHFAFAYEKLVELKELKDLSLSTDPTETPGYKNNVALFGNRENAVNLTVQEKVSQLTDKDFIRLPEFKERQQIQKDRFKLPLLPTTTIGSFPQTADVKANRSAFKKGEISEDEYVAFNKKRIAECVQLQEDIGLDVLVHGEFERNDMVEYFGESLDGYIFTKQAWVQSYGTRCVKPPVIWGDISRRNSITVDWSSYAQTLTDKPMKGMLTGPVTILNWSFPREDISLKESAFQIGLAIRDEVLDLEAHGIKIIQIDEAALREKLPLRKSDWRKDYLDWTIPAFRMTHSNVRPETQIHTHMCYSEFADIIKEIDNMDADVITFEASRSDLSILDALKESNFRTEVGPGVYDIHSPRIPSKDEIKKTLKKILGSVSADHVWVNPDCGLKTRGNPETIASLKHLVEAAKEVRNENN